MKQLKKLAAVLLAVVMTLAMNMTVFAEETAPTAAPSPTTYTLTLTGTATGHTYEAYQIFKGDLSDSTLSNIDWGSGVKGDDLLDALKKDADLQDDFASVTSAASVAAVLANEKDESVVVQEFATVVSQHLSSTKVSVASKATETPISGLEAGYYLVKDQDGTQTNTSDAYTRFILKVVGNTKAAVKSNVPTVKKKVKDTNDSTGVTSDWQDSADADIGDDVQYQITGTMPDNINDYKTYKYVFTDTMSKGLTYTEKNAKIKIGTTDVTSSFTEVVTPDTTTGVTTVTWTCDDLKDIKDANGDKITIAANTKVVVEYSATLNKDAVIGDTGNPNEVYLTYSNNPNKGGDGDTGTTPKDKNIVFTYKVVVNKVDQEQKSLAGAAFKLEKKVPGKDGKIEYKAVASETVSTDGTTFTFSGLDDGDYKLTETTTPNGYNTIDPVEFTISAEHDTESDNPQLTKLSGNAANGEVITFTPDTKDGSLTTNIVNKKGSTLPSTGGAGTRMFYVFGGCLVAAAVVLLALKKRKEA